MRYIMRNIIIMLILCGTLHAQEALPVFAGQPRMSLVKIEDVTDSVDLMQLPALSCIERVMVVIDSAIADVTSFSVGIKNQGTANLYELSSFPEGDGNIIPFQDGAGSAFITEPPIQPPLWYCTAAPQTVVFHVTTSGGTPVGQLRIFFFPHYFGEQP